MIKKHFAYCADANHKANQSKSTNTSDNPITSMLKKLPVILDLQIYIRFCIRYPQ